MFLIYIIGTLILKWFELVYMFNTILRFHKTKSDNSTNFTRLDEYIFIWI